MPTLRLCCSSASTSAPANSSKLRSRYVLAACICQHITTSTNFPKLLDFYQQTPLKAHSSALPRPLQQLFFAGNARPHIVCMCIQDIHCFNILAPNCLVMINCTPQRQCTVRGQGRRIGGCATGNAGRFLCAENAGGTCFPCGDVGAQFQHQQ